MPVEVKMVDRVRGLLPVKFCEGQPDRESLSRSRILSAIYTPCYQGLPMLLVIDVCKLVAGARNF
jgi:hypothetical protein